MRLVQAPGRPRPPSELCRQEAIHRAPHLTGGGLLKTTLVASFIRRRDQHVLPLTWEVGGDGADDRSLHAILRAVACFRRGWRVLTLICEVEG